MNIPVLSVEDNHDGLQSNHCQHCGSIVPTHRSDRFCCAGCSAVYQLLSGANLTGYYRIRDELGVFRAPGPIRPLSERVTESHPFLFLDDSVFRLELGISSTHPRVQFYLEGVHCTACLWLIEQIPTLLPDEVLTARLDLQNSVVDIYFKEKGSISKVADYLDRLGYRPHSIFSSSQKNELSKKESRQFLFKLALAGALTGNIMIFAVSIYAGANGWIKDHFDWIILFLSTPVFFYCATPLYRSAWNAIKNKRWSVDIPIVLALAAGFTTSAYSVFTGGDQNYLDSLSGLVFLLLGSRYFLIRLQKNVFEGLQFSDSFYPEKILRNENEYVWVRDLEAGDIVEIPPGLRIPVDGTVVRGQSYVNESLMTGESLPKRVIEHEEVYAGSINSDYTLWLRVKSIGDQTRIGKIASEVQRFEMNRNSTVILAEKLAKFFTLFVLLWAASVFLYFTLIEHLPLEGVRRVLSILIVSCPCAFALATPLALIQAFQVLIKRGVYLKDPNEIEKVLAIKRVAFDKTGTLTEGVLELQSVQWCDDFSSDEQSRYLRVVRALESDSKHPVARALLRYIDSHLISNLKEHIANKLEIAGKGILGTWKYHNVAIKSFIHDKTIDSILKMDSIHTTFEIDGKVIATFSFRDRLKPEAIDVVNELEGRGLSVWILSGDTSGPVEDIALTLGLPHSRVFSSLSPEEKGEWLKHHTGTLYVGDGANDGLALSNASLGIAANGALDLSMKAAGAYLTQNSLQGVLDLFTVSEETRKILKRHLIFTVFYNSSTITLASLGLLKPLIAAVLMPLSSIAILISTQIGTQKLRQFK